MTQESASSTSLRLARRQDLPRVEAHYRAVVEAMLASGLDQWNEAYPTRADFQEDIRRERLYLLERDGELLAAAAMDQSPNPPDCYDHIPWHSVEPARYLHRMAVSPAHAGRGVGKRFLRALMELAAASGAVSMRLDTRYDNARALALYESMGFIRRGICHFARTEKDFVCLDRTL